MQKIGLTGVTGHLGSNVYRRLNELGMECKTLQRKNSGRFPENEVVTGDLNNRENLSDFTRRCSAVIHCASMVWPKKGRNPELIRTNVDGTKLLLEECKKNQVKHFVYVSSIHSMNIPDHSRVFDESATLTTDDSVAYNFSKAEVERYLSKQTGIRITIINPTGIIGPGDKNLKAMNQLFYLLFQDKLPLVTSGGYYVIDVRTVAEALVNAILLNKTGKYLVAGEYFSIKELTSIYGKVNGINGDRKAIPEWLMKILSSFAKAVEYFDKKPWPLNSYAVETMLNVHPDINSDKALRDLELTHIPIEKTLKDLNEWFVNEFTYD